MTCSAPYTALGLEAPDPFAGAESQPAACAFGDEPERFVTLEELAKHPKGCKFEDFEDLARWCLGCVSDKVDEFYGAPQAPCTGMRGFRSQGCRGLDIPHALRIDAVDVGPCGCGHTTSWTPLDLCSVVVESPTGMPPYQRITGCPLCSTCGNTHVRVTGVWGLAWPISASIKFAVITVAAKLFQVSRETGQVQGSVVDGVTTYAVPDSFSFSELRELLSRKEANYSAVQV